ncbi:hypothetical protein [Methanobrevibacter sp.]
MQRINLVIFNQYVQIVKKLTPLSSPLGKMEEPHKHRGKTEVILK